MADFLITVGVEQSATYSEFENGINAVIGQINGKPHKIKLEADTSAFGKEFKKQITESLASISTSATASIRPLEEIARMIDEINKKDFSLSINVSDADTGRQELGKYTEQVRDYIRELQDAYAAVTTITKRNEWKLNVGDGLNKEIVQLSKDSQEYEKVLANLEKRLNSTSSFAGAERVAKDAQAYWNNVLPILQKAKELGILTQGSSFGVFPEVPTQSADTMSRLASALGLVRENASAATKATSEMLNGEQGKIDQLTSGYEEHSTTVKGAADAEKVKGDRSKELASSLQGEANALNEVSEASAKDAVSAKESAEAYKELTNTLGKIQKARLSIAGLDPEKNAQQIGALRDQLRGYEQEYEKLFQKRGNTFSEDQLSGIAKKWEEIAQLEQAAAAKNGDEYEASLKAMSDGLQTMSANLEDAKRRFDAIKQPSDELSNSFAKLNSLMGTMKSESSSDREKVEAYRQWSSVLKEVNAELKIETNTKRESDKADKEQIANMGKLSTLLKQINQEQERLSKSSGGSNTDRYQKLEALRVEVENLQKAEKIGTKDANSLVTKFKEISSAAGTGASTIKAFGSSINQFESQIVRAVSAANLLMQAFRQLKQMAKTAVEIDSAMTQLRVVTNNTSAEYAAYGKNVASTAQEIGASIKDLIDSTTVFARLGYSLEESSGLAKYTTMLKNVGDIEVSDAQNALTAITKAYNISANEIESVMDKMVTVGNNFPISVAQIAEGMNNAGSALAAAGNSFEQSVALLTAANTTIQNISKASTGLRTITARIRKTTAELDDLGETIETAKYEEVINNLTKHRVLLTEENGEYRTTYEIMQDIAGVWDELSSMEQAAVAEQLSGNRQQNVFFSIVEQFQEASRAYDAMQESTGAMSTAYAEYMDSMQARIDRFKAAYQTLAQDITDSALTKWLVDAGTAILNILDKVISGIDKLLGLAPMLTSAFGFIIGKNIVKTIIEPIKSLVSTVRVFRELSGSVSSIGAAFRIVGTEAATTANGIQLLSTAAVNASAIFAGVGAAIGVVIAIIARYNQAQKEMRREAAQAGDAYLNNISQSRSDMEAYISKIQDLKDKISEGNLSNQELYETQSQLLGIQDELTDRYGAQAGALDLISSSADSAAASIAKLQDAYEKEQAIEYLATNQQEIGKATEQIEQVDKYINHERVGLENRLTKDSAAWARLQEIFNKYQSVSYSFADTGMRYVDENGLVKDNGIEHALELTIETDFKNAKQDIQGLLTDVYKLQAELGRPVDIDLSALENKLSQLESDEKFQEWERIYDSATKARIAANDDYAAAYSKLLKAENSYKKAVAGTYDTQEEKAAAVRDAIGEIQEAISGVNGLTFADGDRGVQSFLQDFIQKVEKESASETLRLNFKAAVQNEEYPKENVERLRRMYETYSRRYQHTGSQGDKDTYLALFARYRDAFRELQETVTLQDSLSSALSIIAGESGEVTRSQIKLLGQSKEVREGNIDAMNEEQLAYSMLQGVADKYGITIDDLIDEMIDLGIAQSEWSTSANDNIIQLITLQDELSKTTKRLQEYKTALEGGEKDDAIKQYAAAYQQFVEDMEAGRTDSNAVHAITKLFFGDEQLAQLGYDIDKASKELSKDMYKAIFKDDKNYAQNFANYLRESYSSAMDGVYEIIDNGDGTFDIDIKDFELLAEKLGMDIDFFFALANAMDLFGSQVMMTKTQVAELAEELGIIGDNAPVENIDKLSLAIEGLAKKGLDGTKIRQYLDALSNAGFIDIDISDEELGKKIQEIKETVGEVEEGEKKITVDAETTSAERKLNRVRRMLEALLGRKIIDIDVQTSVGTTTATKSSTKSRAIAVPQADGTKDAQGGATLVNELGPELIAENGRAYIAGGGRPTIVDLTKGAIVLNAEDTKRALRGRKTSDSAFIIRSMAPGNATYSVAGGFKTESVTSGSSGVAAKNEEVLSELDALISEYQKAISYTQNMLDRAIEDNDYISVQEYTSTIVAYYKQMMDAIQQEKEKYRAQGLSDTSDEIRDLEQKWWEYYDAIRDVSAKSFQALADKAADSLHEITNAYDTLKGAAQEYAENGFITIDTLEQICQMGIQYLAYLQDENGQLVLNEENIQRVIAARTEQYAVETALNYVEQLRSAIELQDAAALEALLYATEGATGATWDLVYAQLASLDLTDDQFSAAVSRVNALRSLTQTAISGIGRTTGTVKKSQKEAHEGLQKILQLTQDMIKWENEQQIQALEDQKDAYAEIIEKRKEMIRLAKEQEDHEASIADKVKQIAKLQAQIDQLMLDESREAQAKRRQLEEDLYNLQKDLADEQAEYSIGIQEDALDQELEAHNEMIDEQIKALEEMLSSAEKLYQAAISRINSGWNSLYKDLLSWNYEYGNTIQTDLVDAWNEASAAVRRYGSFVSALANTEDSGDYSGATSLGSSIGSQVSQGTTEDAVKAIVSRMKKNSADWHSADSAKRKALEQENENLAKRLSSLLGKPITKTNGTWYIDGKELYKMYHTGGIAGDSPTLQQNEMLAVLKKGEAILDERREQGLYKLIDFTQVLSDKLGKLVSTPSFDRVFGSLSPSRPGDRTLPVPRQAEGMSFSPVINVNIAHSGSMDERDAEHYGQIAADTTLQRLKDAFSKRGITSIAGAALKA